MPFIDVKHKFRGGWGSYITSVCAELQISAANLDEELFEDISSAAAELPVMSDDDAIRELYAQFAGRKYTHSHLAVLFHMPKPRVSEYIHNPDIGKRPEGRERILSEAEEMAVLKYVQDCQEGFNCVEPKILTEFIRNMIVDSPYPDRHISDTFVYKNKVFVDKLSLVKPLRIEDIRLKACQYDIFKDYFNNLSKLMSEKNFDPDLIVNMDETTASAAETRASKSAYCVKELNIPAVSAKLPPDEHITLSCAVSASGRALIPTFILSNKTVGAEDKMHAKYFNYGPYNLTYSASGWQDNVSVFLNNYIIHKHLMVALIYIYIMDSGHS